MSYTTDFEQVRRGELAYIARRRQMGDQPPEQKEVAESLVGLALSGGGIRSATTNLGILQALSRMDSLRLVDYLSTVSGGGYIGGCLSSLLSINHTAETHPGELGQYKYETRSDLKFTTKWKHFPFNPELKPPEGSCADGHAAHPPGKKIVAHLRTHGDFLIARRSIFRRDALRAVGTLLTGIVYHLLLVAASLFIISVLLLGAAHVLSEDVAGWRDDLADTTVSTARTQFTIAGLDEPLVVSREADNAGFGLELRHRLSGIWDDTIGGVSSTEARVAAMAGALVTVLVLVIFWVTLKWWKGPARWGAGESREDAFENRLLTLSAMLLLFTIVGVTWANYQVTPERPSTIWLLQPLIVVVGAAVASFVIYAVVFAQLGQITHLWSRQCRSLWGSYQAITVYGIVAALLFAALPVASYIAYAVGVAGVLAPMGSLVAGRLLISQPVDRAAGRFRLSRTLLHILLAVAVAGLIGFTMMEFGALAIHLNFADPVGRREAFVSAVLLGGFALGALCLMGNINKISPHFFYRDRLLETYLRTEVRDDQPDNTGRMKTFRDTMEMPLKEMHGDGPDDVAGNTAPYLLISAALNLAGSRDLTRKDRKSGYFLFSKYWIGSPQTGYRTTTDYRGGRLPLGRALTVSGAAAGTGMGYQTFFAQSFLMALFNARLGYWMANPRSNSWEGLAFWPAYLLLETFAMTSERKRLVNVSDGGHTGDNVGIYPLFERRCQVIIACDAEADATLSFGSFTEALRHAYIDLGVDVDIDLSMIRPDPVTGLTKAHCAIGRIRYPECPSRPGWLIYLKNSLTGDEPAPVLNYKRSCVDFPHESTADQFFDDAQFESYRALGVHIAEHAFASWISDPDVKYALGLTHRKPMEPQDTDCRQGPRPLRRPDAWQDLLIRHSPFRAAEDQDFQELTRQLSALEQLFLEKPALQAYYAECMNLKLVPSDGAVAPSEAPEVIHVCAMQIQLMEDVYFSLRLDQYANARDNRGWMNLFRRWGNSATFRKYFKQLRSTYSNDLVDFYCSYIDLWPPIDEAPVPHAWDVDADDEHVSAQLSHKRGARGVCLDPGRREAGAPSGEESEAVREPERTTPGQHGESTGLTGETTPPSPDTGGQ